MYSTSSATGAVVSLLTGTVGAILYFAVSKTVNGLNLNAVGVILMIVGAVGLVVSSIMFAAIRSRRTVYSEPVVPVTQVDGNGRPLRY